MGWERERYSWDAAAGTVGIETLDPNLWGPGSGWRYQLTPADGGAGARALGRQLQAVLRKAEESI